MSLALLVMGAGLLLSLAYLGRAITNAIKGKEYFVFAVLVSTPILMVAASVFGYAIWKAGGPSYYNNVVEPNQGSHTLLAWLVMIPSVLFAFFCWWLPIKWVRGVAEGKHLEWLQQPIREPNARGKMVTVAFRSRDDSTTIAVTGIYLIALLWGLTAGAALLIVG